MNELLSLNFWFTMKGELMTVTSYALIFIFVSFFIVGFYLQLTKSTWKKSLMRNVKNGLISFFFTNFIIALYLWFVMSQVVPVLSARFWLLIWAFEVILWLYNIYKGYRDIPRIKAEIESRRGNKRYIP